GCGAATWGGARRCARAGSRSTAHRRSAACCPGGSPCHRSPRSTDRDPRPHRSTGSRSGSETDRCAPRAARRNLTGGGQVIGLSARPSGAPPVEPLTIALVAAVVVVTVLALAPKVGVAAPLLLVAIGVGLSLLPMVP